MQSDPMAREKLAEGIAQFSKDIDQLLELLKTA
jgi:transaldolase